MKTWLRWKPSNMYSKCSITTYNILSKNNTQGLQIVLISNSKIQSSKTQMRCDHLPRWSDTVNTNVPWWFQPQRHFLCYDKFMGQGWQLRSTSCTTQTSCSGSVWAGSARCSCLGARLASGGDSWEVDGLVSSSATVGCEPPAPSPSGPRSAQPSGILDLSWVQLLVSFHLHLGPADTFSDSFVQSIYRPRESQHEWWLLMLTPDCSGVIWLSQKWLPL